MASLCAESAQPAMPRPIPSLAPVTIAILPFGALVMCASVALRAALTCWDNKYIGRIFVKLAGLSGWKPCTKLIHFLSNRWDEELLGPSAAMRDIVPALIISPDLTVVCARLVCQDFYLGHKMNVLYANP